MILTLNKHLSITILVHNNPRDKGKKNLIFFPRKVPQVFEYYFSITGGSDIPKTVKFWSFISRRHFERFFVNDTFLPSDNFLFLKMLFLRLYRTTVKIIDPSFFFILGFLMGCDQSKLFERNLIPMSSLIVFIIRLTL